MNDLKSLATFIYTHSADTADHKSVAFVHGILSDKKNTEAIETVVHRLDMDGTTEFIKYDETQDIEDLLKRLFELLQDRKVVFLDIYAKRLNPILFDQISCYKETNSFQGVLPKHNVELSHRQFPGGSNLFLIFHIEPNEEPMAVYYELSDHTIDMRNESDEVVKHTYVN